MLQQESAPPKPRAGRARVPIIDCDVHPVPQEPQELVEYAPPEWRRALAVDADRGGARRASGSGRNFYFAPNGGRRVDSRPARGGPPGSDPDLMERQLFDEAGIDIAMLLPVVVGLSPDPRLDAALSSALNEWSAATWLSKYNHHGKYRGAICVSVHNPVAAVREIEKWAGHQYFSQIMVVSGAQPAYGHPQYHPIWEAAARHKLPVSMHVSGLDRIPTVGVGFTGHFIDYHSISYAVTYGAHLVSLLSQGVFELFPDFRFVAVEGGFAWWASLLCRLDNDWIAFRDEMPLLKRKPSEYARECIRFTSQPIEEPSDNGDLVKLFEILNAEDVLMYASDYPHWDFDDPVRAMPRISREAKRRIFYENASELYGITVSEAG